MGSTPSQIADVVRIDDRLEASEFELEQPQHRVQITEPFYLGKYEVTLGQFLKFYHAQREQDPSFKLGCEKGEGGEGYEPGDDMGPLIKAKRYRPWSWGHPDQTMQHPVVNVSWNDATEFCKWLSRLEGADYRLPTEAQREYACRAGSRGLWPNGDDPEAMASHGNIFDRATEGKYEPHGGIKASDGYAFTAPVGRSTANDFGLHDMHGNVWEWCSDRLDFAVGYYNNAPASDRIGPASGERRVSRGGSWYDPPVHTRSAFRSGGFPDDPHRDLGFRVSRTK